MDSSQTDSTFQQRSLRFVDYAILLLLCVLLFGFSLVQPRALTTHETTHCLNVREMFQSGEYLIPTYGGRPWLERPPAPHWLTGIPASIVGGLNAEWAMRVGSILIATIAVLVFAWAVAGCFGRTIGLMSGAILATMREFAAYAVGPEADIFLASTVTICGALLMRLQFARPEPAMSFFGRRTWLMLSFFFLLGLTNWMKGPLFGMIFVVLPMTGYLLWSRDAASIRRFAWLWGLLILVAVGTGWPIIAYLRYPDIVELWAVDYGIRWQSGYLGEPFWYYLVQQPWNLFPWTIPVLLGLAATWKGATRDVNQPMRFIWCWAILPVVFFSLFKGKHHHYMLSCLAPAAVLGAYGSIALWKWIRQWPAQVREPWFALIALGVPGTVLLLLFGRRIPGPAWTWWVAVGAWPFAAHLLWWVASHREGRLAFGGMCAIIVALNCLAYAHRSQFMDSYVADSAFVGQVKQQTRDGKPILVANDDHPLNSSWLLYYLGDRARLLHNHTFLRDDRIASADVYVICRQRDEMHLAKYGVARMLTQSAKARGELTTVDRWTLYELRFHPHLARMPGDVRISPMQATGRRPGPFLGEDPRLAAR